MGFRDQAVMAKDFLHEKFVLLRRFGLSLLGLSDILAPLQVYALGNQARHCTRLE
jgi:hypothetical protein